MPKINLSVPDDMKARMDAAGDRRNWSAVARRAFDLELKHIESIMEIKTMNQVIERLKASKAMSAANSEDDGRHAGRLWAKERAEYDELKRVGGLEMHIFSENFEDPDGSCLDIVVRAIAADEADGLDGDEIAYMFGIVRDEIDVTLTRDFLVGFVMGAQEVWEEVADKL